MLALAWRHLLAGLGFGVPVAWWLSRGFAALLFQVTPADASVYIGRRCTGERVWMPGRLDPGPPRRPHRSDRQFAALARAMMSPYGIAVRGGLPGQLLLSS
jgi:hypothetical protein